MQTEAGTATPSRLPSLVQAKRPHWASSTGHGDFLGRTLAL
jgi:hypothetical protein